MVPSITALAACHLSTWWPFVSPASHLPSLQSASPESGACPSNAIKKSFPPFSVGKESVVSAKAHISWLCTRRGLIGLVIFYWAAVRTPKSCVEISFQGKACCVHLQPAMGPPGKIDAIQLTQAFRRARRVEWAPWIIQAPPFLFRKINWAVQILCRSQNLLAKWLYSSFCTKGKTNAGKDHSVDIYVKSNKGQKTTSTSQHLNWYEIKSHFCSSWLT